MYKLLLRYLIAILSIMLLAPLPVHAGDSIMLDKRLAHDELLVIPDTITTSLYTSPDTMIPIAIQTYYSGEWQLVSTGQSHSLRVSMEKLDPQYSYHALWYEVAADGVRLGDRTQIRVPGVPDFSSEGVIESRSLLNGGFKYPDGSIQTTAMDASCSPGGSISSLGPDGTFTCEPSGLPVGSILTCGGNNKMNGIDASGNVICSGDIDTTYTAGTGLSLDTEQFSVLFGTTSTRAAVGNHMHAGSYLPIGSSLSCAGNQKVNALSANGSVFCATDVDTKYTAGSGLLLLGEQFSASFGTGSTDIAAGNHTHSTLKALAEKDAELDDLRARLEVLEAILLN